MIPMFMTETASARSGRAKAASWKPPVQNALVAGSHPKATAALAPHNVNPQVIDHG